MNGGENDKREGATFKRLPLYPPVGDLILILKKKRI
jgi:hypothetical protein